ncbi:MAG: cupredoxin domain-containing protein [Reichenbachiella sp.]|uniref:cupredoxin domain-containing protein n=1 Tax=Reichenbachiella sp. TaxID=2184521 RepID=UPI00326497AD
MKKLFLILTVMMAVIISSNEAFAQKKAKKVKLSQVEGEFTTKELTLKPGTYVFEVSNQSVDKEVGFVIAPVTSEGKAGEHIQAGYLAKTINKGETSSSKEVNLTKGTYKYFCPMNPTPEYTLVVK